MKIIFMSATKIDESTTNILKLMFLTMNLHFVKSNQISTYIKLNLPLTSSIYFVFLPLEMQKNSNRPKYTTRFLICLKRSSPRTFKSGSYKNTFLQWVRYWYNLLRWMFFILCDNWKTLLFVKVYRYSETFEPPCCCFLWSQCFKRSLYFMRYLHNNNMMLIPKF